jgi:hypothetical protein
MIFPLLPVWVASLGAGSRAGASRQFLPPATCRMRRRAKQQHQIHASHTAHELSCQALMRREEALRAVGR